MSEHEGPTMASGAVAGDLGVNAWLVEENYQEFLANPLSVSESWRAYFAEAVAKPAPRTSATELVGTVSPPILTNGVHAPLPSAPEQPPVEPDATSTVVSSSPEAAGRSVEVAPVSGPDLTVARIGASVPETPPGSLAVPTEIDEEALPLRGAAARIVENMVASLGVPTATSVHPTPAKALEVNRSIINDHLAKTTGKKVSFTHIIAFALIKAIVKVPQMNASFVEDVDGKGTPGVVRHQHVGLGIAIDVERSNGRSLLVPAIKGADTLDFAGFVAAYEELVQKARNNKLAVDDFAGVTMTLTNPGTLGTTQSVPRLMRGQGAIIGVGALDFPVEFRATDPEVMATLGIGKVVTLTSTYDHRIIQGAESGLFLKHVDEFLVGSNGFYEEIFASLGISMPPVHLSRDSSPTRSSEAAQASGEKQLAVASLIAAYRTHGHRIARTNPLSVRDEQLPAELDPATYGLSAWDLDREFLCPDLDEMSQATLREIIAALERSYCGTIGVEYRHIQSEVEARWLAHELETEPTPLDAQEQRYVLDRLNEAEIFESFLHARYVGQKRFGLEGATSTIAFLDAALLAHAQSGGSEAVLGMSHRGRLNVLANVIGKPVGEIFSDFEQNLDPETVEGSGDMKYHKGGAGIWTGLDGHALPVALVPNPSHLEAVDSVVEGVVRAKQDRQPGDPGARVIAVLMHGDAAFAGQGVVAETLNLSQLPAYRIGGTIHLVINNQIGFTTPAASARSTPYATDVAKAIEAPILHVNGDDPEGVVRVARLACAYRLAFSKDIVIDLVSYREHGHNEGDDPSYTQPLMYREIAEHRPANLIYADTLIGRGVVTEEEVEEGVAKITQRLVDALEVTRKIPAPKVAHLPERSGHQVAPLPKDTAVDQYVLGAMSEQLSKRPADFHIHPKLGRQFDQRDELLSGGDVDWATGEALAFGSIMIEGKNVRLIGQDARRGTFSHRHAVLVDYEDGTEFVPLSGLAELWSGLGTFNVFDSLLSEYAALGFEYGYSVESRETLVIWEAQFGDFVNGAQIVIDNFIMAAQEKWGQTSGLVMLLPHGYEGQGPEHSSARLERFLSGAAGGNVTIAQPTTAAQYFHMLRAHVHNTERRPLIVMSPKYLLRARPARSRLSELSSGSFREVLDDPSGPSLDAARIDRVVLCSGKIAFDAIDRRDARRESNLGGPHSAIVRVEQLYPWPEAEIEGVIRRYPNATELVWLQDEPANMGSWTFVHERLLRDYGDDLPIRRVSRRAAASPATGSHLLHDVELGVLLDEAIGISPVA